MEEAKAEEHLPECLGQQQAELQWPHVLCRSFGMGLGERRGLFG